MIYLPHPDFEVSAQAFDSAMLQVNIDNIINLLENFHETEFAQPVDDRQRLAWKDHEVSLCWYGIVLCVEMERRQLHASSRARLEWHLDMASAGAFSMDRPDWVGDERVHTSHQSQLIAHNPRVYAPAFPGIPDNLPVWWPHGA